MHTCEDVCNSVTSKSTGQISVKRAHRDQQTGLLVAAKFCMHGFNATCILLDGDDHDVIVS